LRAVIKAAPKSEEAFEAYEWLSHLFLYSGQYERLVSTMEARWSAFPGRPGQEQERNVIAGFRGLPDQVTVNVKPATLKHEDRGIFIPLSVNGKAASFFIDTGSWPNAISQSEATRLGLRFTEALGSTATMTNRSSFRTAVADELTVAGVRLKNVSFTVFADDSEPWSLLPPGRRGLLGMPVILAFRTLRWAQDGTVRIGQKPAPFDVHKANLMFDNDHLAIAVDLEGRTAVGAVDTGSESTDLYREFAVQFPSSMKSGTEGTTQVRGIGGAESYQSVTLPEITFEIGKSRATLRHTGVLMNRSVRSYIGNFGLDVFQQGRAFKLDFTAMRLELETDQ
jgi:predicted aspartyl protease